LALNQLGYSLAERNLELETALGYLERAHRLRPEDGGILDSLAWVYFRLGRFAEAEPLARRAIELAGEGAVLVDHLGDILWALGKKEEAIESWRRAYWNARTGDSEDVLTTVPDKLQRAGAPLEEGGEGDGEEDYEEEGEE
jgi:Flp pilus assembly protein TadD